MILCFSVLTPYFTDQKWDIFGNFRNLMEMGGLKRGGAYVLILAQKGGSH